jgi:alpha-tubulin suppressor-like RCC1 family protein
VSLNSIHSVAIAKDGSLWAWGWNHGQIGDGTLTNRFTPIQIGTDTDWVTASAGAEFTAAIKADGSLWTWGSNRFGELGDGTTTLRNTPARVGTGNDWASVAAGSFMDAHANPGHVAAIRTDGTLWAWGSNEHGQLGETTGLWNDWQLAPIQIGEDNNWAFASAGSMHTAVIRADGSLWAWGNNRDGQLGDGTREHRGAPVRVGTNEF